MADPHHVALLDGYDRGSVRAYRAGLGGAAVGLGALTAASAGHAPLEVARWLVVVGAALSLANVHLYDKRIRAVIVGAGWTGAVLLLAPVPWPLVHLAGLGFVFVALSGFALKEQFCFRIPFLRAVPLLLATSLVPLAIGPMPLATALLGAATAALGLLAVAKLRMPLHFDIGDKSRYQV
jgi:uncharacterized integral membrane protein